MAMNGTSLLNMGVKKSLKKSQIISILFLAIASLFNFDLNSHLFIYLFVFGINVLP